MKNRPDYYYASVTRKENLYSFGISRLTKKHQYHKIKLRRRLTQTLIIRKFSYNTCHKVVRRRYICAIMKTMCPHGYHHNGFVAAHALGHMMYGYTLLVAMNQRVLNKQSKKHNISGQIFAC